MQEFSLTTLQWTGSQASILHPAHLSLKSCGQSAVSYFALRRFQSVGSQMQDDLCKCRWDISDILWPLLRLPSCPSKASTHLWLILNHGPLRPFVQYWKHWCSWMQEFSLGILKRVWNRMQDDLCKFRLSSDILCLAYLPVRASHPTSHLVLSCGTP